MRDPRGVRRRVTLSDDAPAAGRAVDGNTGDGERRIDTRPVTALARGVSAHTQAEGPDVRVCARVGLHIGLPPVTPPTTEQTIGGFVRGSRMLRLPQRTSMAATPPYRRRRRT